VFAADNVDAWSDDAIVEAFRRSRAKGYEELAGDLEQVLRRRQKRDAPKAPSARRLLDTFRERFAAIEAIDFFGSAGRDRVGARLQQLEERIAGAASVRIPTVSPAGEIMSYQGRLWMTRPRPGVDRMSSAWLIRRFIDPRARFAFAADRQAVPNDAVPFDMFDVAFSHRGEGCTFETLCAVFGIHDPAVLRIAAIVHDLDLKDARFGAPESSAVGAMIEGLQLAYQDDDALLAHGMTLFDSLHRSFERSARSAQPRQLARSKKNRRRDV
jgi:hypothetical protein